MNQEHLTDEQIKWHAENPSNSVKSIIIGRHLLVCEECRDRAPLPTEEQLWQAIMTDTDEEIIEEVNRSNLTISDLK